jgi:hypothetical protein
MADPNSALTRLRRWLVRRLDVRPAPGESWCENCSLNGGRTRVLSADGGPDHAREHIANGGPIGHFVTITSAWPARGSSGQ